MVAQAGDVSRSAVGALRREHRPCPRHHPAGGTLRLFAAGQPRADGHRAGPHRSQGPQFPDAAARGPVRAAGKCTPPAWACAPISTRAMCARTCAGRCRSSTFRAHLPGDHALFEDPEVEAPHVGCASTTGDLWRFAEMLRREGELDGARLLSPRMVRLARRVHTGDKVNELYRGVALRSGWDVPPANQGLGFQVRGTGVFQHLFGQLSSRLRPSAITARAARCSGSIRKRTCRSPSSARG